LRQKDFYWSNEREPHFTRRKEILKKHPEVKDLLGIDKSLKYKTLALVMFQLATAPLIVQLPWYWCLLIAYIIGASASHTLFLAIHELSHDLAFETKRYNTWLALIANIPIVVPFAASFKTYHLKHHWKQGDVAHDADLPTRKEAKIFRGSIGKTIWAITQILFYAFRPMFAHPTKLGKEHYVNILFQLAAVSIYVFFFGFGAILYLLICIFLAGSLHPLAGHFIAEHYVFKEGQETYSYYGPLNAFALNVGYHNEHHDFPNIPGTRLPALKKLAPSFYDHLYAHKSWVNVLVQFLINPDIDLYSRIKRKH
jgi:sphingolipid delta-4 desaturase